MLPFRPVPDPTGPTGLNRQRYERLGVLGSGGQGVVYRAFDHWTGRPVAIKVLSSKAALQPEMVERLSREQRALSTLKGTAAVEVLDIYRGSDGELCLVMELLSGRNLDEELGSLAEKEERMALPRVAEVFDLIVDTLEVAHGAGILHRDLKPANLFLLDDGGVRLLDFGMARLKRSAPLTADGTVMGSPSFIAPEAWKGQSALVDQRADVYSLGVILFLVLTGELPFSGLSLYEKFLGTTQGERPSLLAKRPDLPRGADDWVEAALAIDPEERFQNVRALWTAFLSTFALKPPKRGRGASFWAQAAEKMRELVGIVEAAPAEAPPSGKEPSFVTQALTGSMVPELRPPTRPTAPAPPAVSDAESIELSEVELRAAPGADNDAPVEKTLEISGTDFVVEDTLPEPVRVVAPESLGAAEAPTGKRGLPRSGKTPSKRGGKKSGKAPGKSGKRKKKDRKKGRRKRQRSR